MSSKIISIGKMENPEELFKSVKQVDAPQSLKDKLMAIPMTEKQLAPIQYLWAIRACAAVLVMSFISLYSVLQSDTSATEQNTTSIYSSINTSNQLYE